MDRSTEFVLTVKKCICNQTQLVLFARREDILQNRFNSLADALRDSLTKLQTFIDYPSIELSDDSILVQKPKQIDVLKLDKSDHETQQCIQECHQMIVEYTECLNATEIGSPQVKLYFSNTIYLIEQKLGQQIDYYTKMRAKRYERLQRVKNAFRFSFHLNKIECLDKESYLDQSTITFDESHIGNSTMNITRPHDLPNNTTTLPLDKPELFDDAEMVLEQENQQLVHEMKTEFDEIKSIQNKLHEISQLQHIFAEEVLKQKEDVEVIADMTVESALNIAEGNKHIRKAIQKQFTSDGIVLFIIIMFTIALWFLDWYQD